MLQIISTRSLESLKANLSRYDHTLNQIEEDVLNGLLMAHMPAGATLRRLKPNPSGEDFSIYFENTTVRGGTLRGAFREMSYVSSEFNLAFRLAMARMENIREVRK